MVEQTAASYDPSAVRRAAAAPAPPAHANESENTAQPRRHLGVGDTTGHPARAPPQHLGLMAALMGGGGGGGGSGVSGVGGGGGGGGGYHNGRA
jgi:hypothetical protein